MNKKTTILLGLLAIAIAGCGIVSGTLFVSQGVDNFEAQNAGSLDESTGSVLVDLTGNDDLDRVDVDGVEDACIRMTAINMLDVAASGELWIMDDTTSTLTPQQVRQQGYSILTGVGLGPSSSHTDTLSLTCAETLQLFQNLDRLSSSLQNKLFRIWGFGDQNQYHIKYEAIFIGMHVTGSL
jgi:hypothetical protein